MTTILFLLGAAMVVLGVRWCMNASQARADERMLANVAAIKAAHEYQLKLRSHTPDGSEQTGQDALSGACLEGVETRPLSSPPPVGTDTAPPRPVCAHRSQPGPLAGAGGPPDPAPARARLGVSPPAPAGTGTAHSGPAPSCARRAQPSLVGAADHPTPASTTPTPAGAGQPPHWHTPAPAGPPRPARTVVHG